MPNVQCQACKKWQSGKKRVNTIKSSEVAQQYRAAFPNVDVRIGDKVCETCRRVMHQSMAETVQQNMETASVAGQSTSSASETPECMDSDYEEPVTPSKPAELIEVPYNRVAVTERVCFVCGSSDARNRVPSEVRKQAFLKRRLFIPALNRCCPSHLIRNRLYDETLMQLRVAASSSMLTSEDVKSYMELLSTVPGATLRERTTRTNESRTRGKRRRRCANLLRSVPQRDTS